MNNLLAALLLLAAWTNTPTAPPTPVPTIATPTITQAATPSATLRVNITPIATIPPGRPKTLPAFRTTPGALTDCEVVGGLAVVVETQRVRIVLDCVLEKD